MSTNDPRRPSFITHDDIEDSPISVPITTEQLRVGPITEYVTLEELHAVEAEQERRQAYLNDVTREDEIRAEDSRHVVDENGREFDRVTWRLWNSPEGYMRFYAGTYRQSAGNQRIEITIDADGLYQSFERAADQMRALNELVSEPRYTQITPTGTPVEPEEQAEADSRLDQLVALYDVQDAEWAREVNSRAADDEVLQSERREAMFRALQADSYMNSWEYAHRNEIAQRTQRSERLPEKPVSFSFLDGPATKAE